VTTLSTGGIRASVSNIQNLIILQAKQQSASAAISAILPAVALTFAEMESNFDPNAVPKGYIKGQATKWYEKKGGSLYIEKVRDSTKFANNPYKNTPELWVAYGLFQLLAVYFIEGTEDPRILFDPQINAARGIADIAEKLAKYNNNPENVRLAYVGYSPTATHSEAEKIRQRFRKIYSKYSNQVY